MHRLLHKIHLKKKKSGSETEFLNQGSYTSTKHLVVMRRLLRAARNYLLAKSSVGVTASKLEKGKICLTKKDPQKECGALSDRIGQTDCTVKCNCSPDRDQSELQKRFLSSLRQSPMPTMGLVRICSAHRALLTLVSKVGL